MNKNNFLALTHLSASLIILISSSAQSADFTIASGNNVTSKQTLVGSDVGLIDAGGSITTTGDDAVLLDGASQASVTNHGTITASGNSKSAILEDTGSSNNIIINNGIIETTEENSTSISSKGSDTVVTNNGTITSNADGTVVAISIGINATGDDVVITNSGNTTSNATSGSVSGVSTTINVSGANVVINNSGNITSNVNAINASGTATGIALSAANVVINNSGNIISSVNGSLGSALGIKAVGDNAVINNSGKIFATADSSSISISGGSGTQTVNLAKGSQIIGTIDLGGGTDNINITGNGVSGRLVTNNVENISFNDGVAGAAVGGTIHTVDPTGSAMLTTGVNKLSLNIHNVVNSRASKVKPRMSGVSSWMQVFGSSFDRGDGRGNLAYKSDHTGIIGGYEWDADSEFSSNNGVMFGLSSGDMNTKTASFDIDSTSVFVGAYKNFNLSRSTFLTTTILAGYEKYESKRRVVDNIHGIQTARSDFDNIFLSPSASLEHRIKLNDSFSIAPEARVAYTSSFFGSQKETGTTTNLATKTRKAQILNSRAGIKAVMNLSEYQVELGGGLDSRIIKESDVKSSVDSTAFEYKTNNDNSVNGKYFKFSVRAGDLKGVSLLASFEKRFAGGNEYETFGQFEATYKF